MPTPLTPSAKIKRTKPEEEPINLTKIVEQCVVESNYANAPATELLLKKGYADSRVYNAICTLGFELLCSEMIGKFIRNHSANMRAQAIREKLARDDAAAKAQAAAGSSDRTQPKPKMDVRQGGHIAAIRAMVQHVSAAAIMPIQGYGRLCDMTFAQVREAANSQDKQVTTMAIRVRYLRAVYEARGRHNEATKTGSVLADADFVQIHDKETADVAA